MPSTTSSVVSVPLDFFNGDNAVFADFVHRVGDEFADLRVVVRQLVATWAIFFLAGNRDGHAS